MQKFCPCLWFNENAEEAANFYISVFKDGKSMFKIYDAKDKGKIKPVSVKFSICDSEFVALNGGTIYQPTPAVSYFVDCETEDEVIGIWDKLSVGGMVFMELEKYPFSEKFGWVQDKYGYSWQISLSYKKQSITPFMMFVGDKHGKAKESMEFYSNIFDNSFIKDIEYYKENDIEPAGTVKQGFFTLGNQNFISMDSSMEHKFTFSVANAFYIYCETQEELDKYWEKLSNGGETLHCGWLIDRFGISWVTVPTCLDEMIMDSDTNKSQKVMEVLLSMKKIDIQRLKDAYNSI